MADGPRPRSYVEAAAIVTGPAALLLDGFLAKHLREWRVPHLPPILNLNNLSLTEPRHNNHLR